MPRKSIKSSSRPPVPLGTLLARRWQRKAGVILVTLLILGLAYLGQKQGWLAAPSAQNDDWRLYHHQNWDITKVIDGDTVELSDGTRIRLWGIDTPEMNYRKPNLGPEPFAQESTEMARTLVEGKTVRLELDPADTRDRYERLLAYIQLPDGTWLNEHLLQAGLARWERRFPHSRRDYYKQLEQQARAEGVGRWASQKPKPRRKKKKFRKRNRADDLRSDSCSEALILSPVDYPFPNLRSLVARLP
ncbi:MAG: thermonuclease family protein [Phycisphaeraceae bacterium]|nr:thermonuclease family protein [Phycisphaeraceae bacterium]